MFHSQVVLSSQPFVFLHSSFVLAPTFHRPGRHQQFAMIPQAAQASVARDVESLVCQFRRPFTDVDRQFKMRTNMESCGCASLRLFFCPSRNRTFSICHCISHRVYLLVVLCSTRLYHQRVEIRSQAQPFLMLCVCLVRLFAIGRGICMPLLGDSTSIRRESCSSVLCLKRAYPWWLSSSSSWTCHLVVPLC